MIFATGSPGIANAALLRVRKKKSVTDSQTARNNLLDVLMTIIIVSLIVAILTQVDYSRR